VVIAMAVKNLPGRQRLWGIALGSGGAVVIRVICTFLVAQLLNMQFIKLVGGAVIIWIAVKLLTEAAKEECHGRECGSIWQALWIIIVADMSMGIDNMLAVGAASQGNLFLLLCAAIPDPSPLPPSRASHGNSMRLRQAPFSNRPAEGS
jgi:YjbE family integral membrane protein